MNDITHPNEKQKCNFCKGVEVDELKYGKLYSCGTVIAHYFCLLFSSNLEQNGADEEGIYGFLIPDIKKELARGNKLNCTYCKKKGATLGCAVDKCKIKFHLPCGIRNESLNVFCGVYSSYCYLHRPRQKIPQHIVRLTQNVICVACQENVQPKASNNTLWAPCCKKNSWFHRECIQKIALSAGYFFKCPICNDQQIFRKEMLNMGIYIPDRDASWEQEPNAFGELLERYNKCDAEVCRCPRGRNFTVSKTCWEIIRCKFCGSQGVHVSCNQLQWKKYEWQCTICEITLGKLEERLKNNKIAESLSEQITVATISNRKRKASLDSSVDLTNNKIHSVSASPLSPTSSTLSSVSSVSSTLSVRIPSLSPSLLASSSSSSLSHLLSAQSSSLTRESTNQRHMRSKQDNSSRGRVLRSTMKNITNSQTVSHNIEQNGGNDVIMVMDEENEIEKNHLSKPAVVINCDTIFCIIDDEKNTTDANKKRIKDLNKNYSNNVSNAIDNNKATNIVANTNNKSNKEKEIVHNNTNNLNTSLSTAIFNISDDDEDDVILVTNDNDTQHVNHDNVTTAGSISTKKRPILDNDDVICIDSDNPPISSGTTISPRLVVPDDSSSRVLVLNKDEQNKLKPIQNALQPVVIIGIQSCGTDFSLQPLNNKLTPATPIIHQGRSQKEIATSSVRIKNVLPRSMSVFNNHMSSKYAKNKETGNSNIIVLE